MKTLFKVIVSGCLLVTTSVFADEITPTFKHMHENILVLKAQKKLKGAKVEIFEVNGELMTSQLLQRRRVVIDFAHVRKGTYVIRLTKGANTQEFLFTSK